MKTKKQDYITYAAVIAVWAIIEILMKMGMLSSHLQGLLVPVVYYAIAAVALNLCVGILGELSLGHAGFMCIGAFSSAIFSLLTQDVLPGVFPGFPDRHCGHRSVRLSDRHTGTASQR